MIGVNETLQQLVERRLLEMGRRRGGGPLSLHEAYQDLLRHEDVASGDLDPIGYELLRRVAKGEHTNIRDRAARSLATMLGVSKAEVQLAAGQPPALEPFTLPPRADALGRRERAVVVAVVDAILAAAARPVGADPDEGVEIEVTSGVSTPPGGTRAKRRRADRRQ